MTHVVRIYILVLLLITGSSKVYAQSGSGCATVMSEAETQWLQSVQQQMEQGGLLFKKSNLTYVPVKIHIVGKSDGTGYIRPELVLEAICKVNRDFAPVGMYFYMPSSIDYINDNDLWTGQYEAVYTTAAEFKVPGMVNIYFHGYSATWCGVYFPNPDVVLVQNSCANYGSTTLTHELGHFFSLPHTFSGWENGNTPSITRREKVDGTNCRSTGDGFCDTGPDYVASRWGCPYLTQLTDPNGVPFKPDPDFYMNYASDACHKRFSNEQITAMQLRLSNRNIGTSMFDTFPAQPPQLLFPAPNDSMVNPQYVTLKWSNVSGAVGYLVQVSRYQYWEAPHVNRFVQDTFVKVSLFDAWPFDWRVKPLLPGNVCGSFSPHATFITNPDVTGIQTVQSSEPQLLVYPNPVVSGQVIQIKSELEGIVTLRTIDGKRVVSGQLKPNQALELQVPAVKGIYLLHLQSETQFITKKITIW